MNSACLQAPKPSLDLNFVLSKVEDFSDSSQFFVTCDYPVSQFLPANTHSHPPEKQLPVDAVDLAKQFLIKASVAQLPSA